MFGAFRVTGADIAAYEAQTQLLYLQPNKMLKTDKNLADMQLQQLVQSRKAKHITNNCLLFVC